MAFNLGYIDVADISIGQSTPGTFHVWRDEECTDSANEDALNFKVRVTHPEFIKTSPSKGTLALGDVVPITVECAALGSGVASDKMRLMIIYSTGDGAKEQKYKIPVSWLEPSQEEAPAEYETAQPDVVEAEPAPSYEEPPAAAGRGQRTQHSDPQPPAAQQEEVRQENDEPPVGSFDISFTVGSVECPASASPSSLEAGKEYHLAWKRASQQGVLQPGLAMARADGGVSLEFDTSNGSAFIPSCVPEHKADGTLARRLLQIMVVDTQSGRMVGSVKFDASRCDEGEKSADVPLKTAPGESGGQLVDICLGMKPTARKSAASENQAATAAPSSPPPAQQRASGASAGGGGGGGGGGATQDLLDRMKAQSDARASSPRLTSKSPRPPSRGFDGGSSSVASPTTVAGGAGFNPLLGQNFEEETVPVPSTSNVGVYVRVRPMLDKLGEGSSSSSWNTIDSGMTLQDNTSKNKYTVDKVFPMDSSNMDIFNELGSQLITNLMSGLNGTLFMYGQTASGKTHTVFGSPGEVGQVNLLLSALFRQVADATSGAGAGEQVDVTVNVSYFEIYNEELNDLLDPSAKNLPVRATGKSGGFAADVCKTTVSGVDEALHILKTGTENKHVGQSVLNDRSSRSHSIFQLRVKKKTTDTNSGKAKTLSAELNLVDLAGSETLSDAGDAANRKETAHINLSLTYLKKVIKELADEASFVSFRNSTLTKILKNSLGGNSKTVLICCVTAASDHRKDTRNTLIFGTTAKTVKTTVKVNASSSAEQNKAMMEEHRRLLEELHQANEAVQAYQGIEEDLRQAQQDNGELLKELEVTHRNLVQVRGELEEAKTRGGNDQGMLTPTAEGEPKQSRGFKAPPTNASGGDNGDAADALLDDFEEVEEDAFEEVAQDEGLEEVEAEQEKAKEVEAQQEKAKEDAKRMEDEVFELKAELQRLKQQNLELKIQHRDEVREKEMDLATANNQIHQQQQQLQESQANEGSVTKASDEVADIMNKEDKIRTLMGQIHQFLHWGTAITLVTTQEKKPPKVERRWLSLLPNSKGEFSLALYGIKEGTKDGTPAPAQQPAEPNRNNLIEKFHLSDCKKVIMGHDEELLGQAIKSLAPDTSAIKNEGGDGATVEQSPLHPGTFHRTFSVVFRKKKYLHVVCQDHSDFEAWVVNLNKMLNSQAAWCNPLDLEHLGTEDENEKYALQDLPSQASKDFCKQMQIKPSQYLHSQDKIAQRRDRFITLFDVRSSAKLDLYHSQRLFQHMRAQGYIAQATLFYLTDRFAASLMVEGGEDDPFANFANSPRAETETTPNRLQVVDDEQS